MHCFILYNPLAGGGSAAEKSEKLASLLPGYEINYRDITKLRDYGAFFRSLDKQDIVIICGGDGTLNRFVNRTASLRIENPIYVYAAGNANDFVQDLEKSRQASHCCVNDYLKYLPVVTVKGRDYRFINGVSCGTEGVINSLKLLLSPMGEHSLAQHIAEVFKFLFSYRPCSAVVSVDGIKHLYSRVWMAPTVNGRYVNGGLSPVPEQDRFSENGSVSVLILHNCGRLRTMLSSPSIFRGDTEKMRGMVDVLTGHDVSVRFDRPAELQIDGESINGINGYRVRSAAMIKKALPINVCIPEAGLEPVYSV